MILSRTDKERKLPSLSLIRWLVIITGFILFLLVSFVLYIRSADSGHRHAEKKAYQIAQNQGGLKEVNKASIHTWDETVWVVRGEDSEGNEWLVWEREQELVKRKVSENVSEEQMLDMFARENAGRIALRILPGWFQGQPVWEIRSRNEPRDGHQLIEFYSFENGTKLRTYWLAS
ncbi:DUF5590 domain-containing protein [Cohnella sp.]|uniref:cell wall elongation regulator TseB-like domain-containing protein n=1 Tax=Cohnella sp. TaxID=1883426 RepID=UPI0035612F78